MAIYLIRHTTPKIEKGICYGQTDLDVSSTFSTELQRIKENLPNYSIPIISSPLKRCLLLAKQLSKNGDIKTDKRLMELNFGKWELKPWDGIDQAEINPWYQDYINIAPPEGESYKQMSGRINRFYDEQISERTGDLIIVSHAGAIRALLAKHNNISLTQSLEIPLKYGEIVKL